MVERYYDRGTLFDNFSRKEFVDEVMPENAFLNPGRDFYDSDRDYFLSLLSAEFDGPRPVRPDPFEDKVDLYEAPGVVVAVGDCIELYELRPSGYQLGDVFDEMTDGYSSGNIRDKGEVSFDEGIEAEVERIFDMI
jgi:hypothetical protein